MPARFPRSIAIDLPDGRSLALTHASSTGGRPVRITPISRISPRFFDDCPICGAAATDDEHVPPASIGGRVMTRTCGPCNNRLGSNVESDLTDWHDGALTLPGFTAEVLPGRRRTSRILFRTTPSGEFVLVIDGRADPAVVDMLNSGQVDLSAYLPDRNRWRLGLLKHAFVAACLQFGALEGAEADAVRGDLIAARDAPTRHDVPRSPLALGLTVLRSHDGPVVEWPVVYALANVDGTPTHGVLLGGTTFVSWSSEPRDEVAHAAQLSVPLVVGARLEGVVSSVQP
ncbi:MAG: HNH endonuclease [Actinomycetota bacterium]|nr:HNH endonuclease [Actinomycetota bacterium]